MDSTTILKKLDRIDDLPTLPAIAMEVNTMLQDYNVSVQDLCGKIENDQSIVPKILKLVNSAFFGLKSKVANISHAIVVLGFNTVRNAIVSVSIIDAFSDKKSLDGFDITEFWSHSVAVAVISKYLAENSRLSSPEDAFTAGLLHDIGKVVLFQYFHDLFTKAWTSSKKNNLSFYDAEKKENSITHARIGTYLAKKWQLPENLVDIVKHHHMVSKNINDFELLATVHAADVIANSFMVNPPKKLHLSAINPDVLKALRPQIDTIAEWFPGILENINSACDFFLEGVKR